MTTPTYEHTRAWKQALALVTHVYKLTQTFPPEEKSGIAGGMRKSIAALPLKLADCWAQDEYTPALAAANAGHALIRDTLVQAQVAYHLALITKHQLADLRKHTARAAHTLDAMLDDLFEEETEEQHETRKAA
ncbi:MAG: four helix bundle protein [Phycisphaerales bacterium JB063]